MNLQSFRKLLNADPESYDFLRIEMNDIFTREYKEALQLYLQRQNLKLQKKLQSISDLEILEEEKLFLEKIIQLRYCLATDSLELTDIDLPEFKSEILQAEAFFVQGLAYEKTGQYNLGANSYQLAANLFEKHICPIRSLISLHNKITCLSKTHPERNFTPEYNFLYRKARKEKNHAVAGICMYNIASEMKRLGSLSRALHLTNKALVLLQSEVGTYHFDMILLQRCQILCEMQNFQGAHQDFLLLKNSSHSQVQAGLKALQEMITDEKCLSDDERQMLHPTWLERLMQKSSKEKQELSQHEEKVLDLLSKGPWKRKDLITEIYGNKISAHDASNRFKNLLFRLSRKCPGAVVSEGGSLKLG
ncbi:MAG: hypothetical protein ACOYOK_09445 [Pseudobdellovibrionaceae bacterium]